MSAVAAVLVALFAVAGPAVADEADATDGLLDLVSNGCVEATIAGRPLKDFAADRKAQRADEKFAGAFLGKDRGTVYLKADPQYPMVLAERPEGPCTVNAQFPGDLTAMIAAVEDFIAGPGGGFYPVRTFEEQAAAGGWTTHRIYHGRRRGKNLTVLFSTTPEAKSIDQIMIAVAETKR